MEKLELAYDSWGDGVLKYLNLMRNASQMCDVRILLEQDEVLLAHRCVLAASSPFFMSILDGEDDAEIDLGEFPGEIIKHVLEFIYSGQSSVDLAELELFHAVAETLQISVLADMVKGIADHNVSAITQVKEEASHVHDVTSEGDSLTLADVVASLTVMHDLSDSDVFTEKIKSPKPECKRGRPKKTKLSTPTKTKLSTPTTSVVEEDPIMTKSPSEHSMPDDDWGVNLDNINEALHVSLILLS
jgi:hypothetical protein